MGGVGAEVLTWPRVSALVLVPVLVPVLALIPALIPALVPVLVPVLVRPFGNDLRPSFVAKGEVLVTGVRGSS